MKMGIKKQKLTIMMMVRDWSFLLMKREIMFPEQNMIRMAMLLNNKHSDGGTVICPASFLGYRIVLPIFCLIFLIFHCFFSIVE